MDAKTARICYEDFEVNSVRSYGPRRVTREEIVEFAAEFDPQPMHLDEDAANKSMLKGLSASGWHSCAIMMRMIYDGFLSESSSLGAPGVDEVRWIRPVRPDDELTIKLTCLEKRDMKSRPHVGVVRHALEMTNAKGETVMTSAYSGFFGKRSPGAA
ncbi:MAG: MaoC family dehydratase [Rhizobiales bacterium]|nr:MaoC family dehydratase [Hyphomicrobiales bacterium]